MSAQAIEWMFFGIMGLYVFVGLAIVATFVFDVGGWRKR